MATDLLEDIAVAKVTTMVVLGGTAFLITLLPVFVGKRFADKGPTKLKSNAQMDFVLSLFLSFGGGVLLSTTFIHLLPEVTENIEILKRKGSIPEDFPLSLPELIMCCGFFIMYIVEEVVHKYLDSQHHKKAKQKCDNPIEAVSSAVVMDTEMTRTEAHKEILKQEVFNVVSPQPHEEDVKIVPTNSKNYGSSQACSLREEMNHNHAHHHDHDTHEHHHHHGDHHEFEDHHTMVTDHPPSLRELLIVLALTIHESFEGLAIGLEESVGAVWYMMAAVAVHKFVIAFCIGIELVSGHISVPLSVFYAFIYSCASPFGIAIGLFMTSSDNDHLMAIYSVILQGMATGTLLYVVFFEILKRDSHSEKGLTQMVVVILGFTVMVTLMYILDT